MVYITLGITKECNSGLSLQWVEVLSGDQNNGYQKEI